MEITAGSRGRITEIKVRKEGRKEGWTYSKRVKMKEVDRGNL